MDRALLGCLQEDATSSYAALGEAVGLSSAAAHERVRKLRERGVIRRTTIDVDPVAVGKGVLAYVMIESTAWLGGEETGDALRALPSVEEAHIVAGGPSVLVKMRAATTADLQAGLRRLFDIDGVSGTRTIVVLETFFERPMEVTLVESIENR
ncbi:Lrp/AsnC family transcriptional regulator [Amycolatopsis sp. H20-H5]|uniref:Lrp/AsnC family transcriptional regulator n=1 Tax=Amycolatopsis sp. H20-H5 TaxID=3046309 RepID=UPI002DB6CE14|nr:Lrp/AsnC family transcriptional regulator [Amycolatopsis sp. H20-H5]MEC3976177.1 Lrp/AsnC family transcriptional regulator [Amycolatopsis sp. H20-H5]